MKNISKIGIGSVQFGLPYGISNTTGQTPPDEVAKIFDVAHANGIRIIDTASAYGTSESVIGMLHDNRFLLVSKFMPPHENESIEEQLAKSLSLLQTDSLYGYLAHRPLELLQDPKVWETLQELKVANKIKKIGFSLNTPEEYVTLKAAGFTPDLVQVPFNYFDTRFQDILIELKANGCEIHTRSAFLQGLFFAKPSKLSPFFDALKPKLQYLHEQYTDSLQGALLQYVVQQEFIDVVIMGIETATQLENNIHSLANAPDLEPLDVAYSNELLMPLHWPKN
jgi:aryl-alcohol dehydrogenase-like predicted oxidoreductase